MRFRPRWPEILPSGRFGGGRWLNAGSGGLNGGFGWLHGWKCGFERGDGRLQRWGGWLGLAGAGCCWDWLLLGFVIDRRLVRLAALKKAIGNKKRPSVYIDIPELHVGQATIDPAAETELSLFCTELGFKVIDPDEGEKSDADVL
jgi:hypothetical protein